MTGRISTLVTRVTRCTGALLIVLVSASCGFVIGVAASAARGTP